MLNSGQLAYKLRYGLLALAILAMFFAAAYWIFFTSAYWPACLTLAIVLFLQYLFLGTRDNWPVFLTKSASPLRRSILVGALAAAVLTAAFIATLLEVVDLWHSIKSFYTLYISIALLWAFWSALFWFLLKDTPRYTSLSRIVRRLIAGSILELLISITVQIFLPDRHACSCGRGSYLGIILGSFILFWAFGPAIVLVFIYEKIRMARLDTKNLCTHCDFNLTGSRNANRLQCPECGHPIP